MFTQGPSISLFLHPVITLALHRADIATTLREPRTKDTPHLKQVFRSFSGGFEGCEGWQERRQSVKLAFYSMRPGSRHDLRHLLSSLDPIGFQSPQAPCPVNIIASKVSRLQIFTAEKKKEFSSMKTRRIFVQTDSYEEIGLIARRPAIRGYCTAKHVVYGHPGATQASLSS